MAFLRLSEARAAGREARGYVSKSASQILTEDSRRFSSTDSFDIFLSHSYQDADVILGVKKIIESAGLTAYVDWIEDSGLDRGKVTHATAKILRERMQACSSLVYVHSPNATHSLWMPWELGYFDGIKPGYVWILPLVSESDSEFKRQEYLGLYPPVENLGSWVGQPSLGFADVGEERSSVPLTKAARGMSIVFR